MATLQCGLSKIDFRNVGAPLKNLAYIPAKTENGNSVNVVIDSGSSINLCDQQLAESLNCPILKSKNPVQVICSSGQRLTVDKYISFGLISENGITFGCQDFYIVKNLQTPILAGLPFLMQKNAVINFGTGYITMKKAGKTANFRLKGIFLN